jgi:flagellar hook-associated protein 1 FlgK
MSFFGLEIAKRGLFAQQAALHTTGHNIANANTEGYTRQRVNMEATTPFPYPSLTNNRQAGQMGTGVRIDSIQRLREGFLDLQFRGEYKNVGYYSVRTDTLEKIEVIMNEPTEQGLQNTLDEFWASWQKLSQRPEDDSVREIVLQHGKAVAETFNFIDKELTQLQNNVNQEIKDKAEDMTDILNGIATLNRQIADVVPHGYKPNDLYDQRDVLLDKLSKIADIEVKPGADGMVNVELKNSPNITLVDGTKAGKVEVADSGAKLKDGVTKKWDIKITDTAGAVTSPTTFKSEGEMKALLESRDIIVPSYMDRLDKLAGKMVEEINKQHKLGYGLDGSTGNPFFAEPVPPATTITAATIEVDPALTTKKIAAAKNETPSVPPYNKGNNENALAIYNLKEKTDIDFGTLPDGTVVGKTSFDNFTRQIITKLGIETREAKRLKGNSELLAGEVENRRQSVSGVSLDEEMSNMIKFQHAYNAAARTITAVDEMLDKIINGTGLVGR